MNRREFMALVGAAVAWQLPGHAQGPRKIVRIGILSVGSTTAELTGPTPQSPYANALISGLRELGYLYGQDFLTEPRGGAGMPARFSGLVAELVALDPDVIVAAGPMLPALKQAARTIPIVMSHGEDPIGEGYIQSLAHPGGNFTGLSGQFPERSGKLLELIKEVVPSGRLFGVVWSQLSISSWQAAELAARQRGWTLLALEIKEAADIEAAFRTATAARAHAMLILESGHLFARAGFVADLAARSQLPAIYQLRAFVDAGGLVSYAPSLLDTWRRAATYVDKILKGAKPAELPVEQPTKFELVINLKTAKALGLTIPQSILLRTDEVIE
jgi:putative ABC transport system substrate-binding protein